MNHAPRCLRTLAVLGLMMISAALRAATLDEIEKAIDGKFAKVNSMTYDSETSMEMSQPGFSNKQVTTGKNEMMRDGDKWKMRMESKSTGSMTVAGNTTQTTSTSTMVVDGQFAYMVMDTNGQKMGTKSKADAYTKGAGGKGYLDALRESMDLSVLADEKVDGKDAYVVEAKPKGGAQGGGNMKIYFDKETGFSTQIVSMGPDGKPISTTKMVNVKVNAPIAADRFKFTPPAGVEMQDMTKQP